MSKIKSIRDIFNYLKFSPVMTDYSDIDLGGGIRSRINGNGTSPKSKQKSLKPDEEIETSKAARSVCNDILDYLDKNENK